MPWALPAPGYQRCPSSLPDLLPSLSPPEPWPLLWHFWSVTSAQEAYKSTCVRHSPVKNNFQFTRNNYHPQKIACTQAGEEGVEREERKESGREGGEHTGQVALPGLGVSGRAGGKQRAGLSGLRRTLFCLVLETGMFFWRNYIKAFHSLFTRHLW